MVHKHVQVPQQALDVPLAGELLDAIESARAIPHTIVRERQLGYCHRRSLSVGKPWLNYEDYTNKFSDPNKDRRRLRVVERWMQQGRGVHGVVTVSLQHIFMGQPTQSQATAQELRINDGMFGEKKSVALVEQHDTGVHQTELLKLAFFSSGSVIGKLLLRTATEAQYTGGVALACEQAVEDFYLEQPLLEQDYRYSSPDTYSLRHLVDDVVDFIAEETQLAKLRQAIGYGQ